MTMEPPKTMPETKAHESLATMHMKMRQMMEATTPMPWVMAEASSSLGLSQRGERGFSGLTAGR